VNEKSQGKYSFSHTISGGNGFFVGSGSSEDMKFSSPRVGSFIVKKDSLSLMEQSGDNNNLLMYQKTTQPYTTATSPINFSTSNSIPFPS